MIKFIRIVKRIVLRLMISGSGGGGLRFFKTWLRIMWAFLAVIVSEADNYVYSSTSILNKLY